MSLFGLSVVFIGTLTVTFSYVALAESRGVLRFFAYDRLSALGKQVWVVGWQLVPIGFTLMALGC